MEYLSNKELYICSKFSDDEKILEIGGEEYHHITKVMRHNIGDKIFVTNGIGKIFESEITKIEKENLKAVNLKTLTFQNNFENYTFCIPNLKNSERLKFALEKSVELGVTNFIIFSSERTISKSINLKRLEKISLAAMKQSLHSYFPKIKLANSVKELLNTNNQIILFDQSSNLTFDKNNFNDKNKYFFIFGPEGSLSDNEIKILNSNIIFNLGNNRLRSETAIVKCASILSEMVEGG